MAETDNIHNAAIYGELPAVERFVKGGDAPDAAGAYGIAPLGLAARYDHADIARFLISQGAEIDLRDPQGRTALHHAAEMGCADAMEALLEHNADIDAADRSGRTPLMYSALTGELPAAEMLIGHRADVNARDSEGASALMHAMGVSEGPYYRRLELIELLVSSGADPLQTNAEGRTAVQIAEETARDPELTSLLQAAAGLSVTFGGWEMVGGADCVLCRRLAQWVPGERYPDRIRTEEVEQWLGASLPGRVKYSDIIPFRGSEYIELEVLHAWHAELCDRNQYPFEPGSLRFSETGDKADEQTG